MPKLIFVSGYHNSGKTTLIEKLSQELQRRGYRVGYVKHDPKGHARTDKEGSDTHRMFSILDRVCLISKDFVVLWDKSTPDPFRIVEEYFRDFHVVFLEGWKDLRGVKRLVVDDIPLEGLKVNNLPFEEIIKYILE
ncbi:molybdopterin-guanine dinucleotide biosynthesis protein B [Thermocrinis minervae]|uniref:Molybdopterin-guanine dinucleotide biosynthesis protein B n=1 Tax=Thermocrinis minervae TaxID=381751 RepID=A0A1M6RCZ5_9AQUI|nr:molybdopterin-guanine dinucleotide biosynthesis protein MobB [Thermocrinis minervae]SHK30306.1 molybdopterin-guanine dinucleotide biosynthesis protein B [Thermocrinis minervae]